MWYQNTHNVVVVSSVSNGEDLSVATKNMAETLRSALSVNNDCQHPITMAFPIVSEKVTMSNRLGCLNFGFSDFESSWGILFVHSFYFTFWPREEVALKVGFMAVWAHNMCETPLSPIFSSRMA